MAESSVALKNGVWTINSREELWLELGSQLFDGDLDTFKKCVVEVLTERDPKFELEASERYAASIHGKVLKHSSSLRKGLAESLALLGNNPTALKHCTLHKPESTTAQAVREILSDADWVLWGSLGALLVLLAEASPAEFLSAVESALQKEPCPFDQLFSEEGDVITGGNYLTGLFWALETLAWGEEYLVRTTVLLGELASRDPGGTWANRPASSLTTIYLPWLPQTTATVEKKIAALLTLSREVPEVAWKLLISLLPDSHQISSGTHKPVWRKLIPEDWKEDTSTKEYWEQVSFYAEMAAEMAIADTSKLIEIIEQLNHLPEASFEKMLEHLSSKEIISLPEKERFDLWNKLESFISKHKKYADAKWALPDELILKLENVAKGLTPTDLINLHRRLFDKYDYELYDKRDDRENQKKSLEKQCQLGVKEIFDRGDIKEIIQFSEIVKFPLRVGHSLSFVTETEVDAQILPSIIEGESKKIKDFVAGYIMGRYQTLGLDWASQIDVKTWPNSQIAQFLAFLPFTHDIWNLSEKWLGKNEAEYWNRANVNPYQESTELYIAVDKLIQYQRPKAAIDCLCKILHDNQTLDHGRTFNALQLAITSDESGYMMEEYHIEEIIKSLQSDPSTDQDELFKVEWAYLPLLTKNRGNSPKLLEQRLASDPEFFCEVIRLIYRSDKGPASDKELTENEKNFANNAYRLLREWKTPPGTLSDGTFSGDKFKEWFNSVQTESSNTGHLDVSFSHIGSVLIHSPTDPDGLWIHHAIAEILNKKETIKMRNGFRTAIFNSRGAHWVDPTGAPEKELADEYRKKAEDVENAGYQRIATTLRELAVSYESDAKQIIDEHGAEEE